MTIYIGGKSALAIARFCAAQKSCAGGRGSVRLPNRAPGADAIKSVLENIAGKMRKAGIAAEHGVEAFLSRPLDIYISDASGRGRSSRLAGRARMHVATGGLTRGMFYAISNEVFVARPELALLQTLSGLSRADSLLVASEACATYFARDMGQRLFVDVPEMQNPQAAFCRATDGQDPKPGQSHDTYQNPGKDPGRGEAQNPPQPHTPQPHAQGRIAYNAAQLATLSALDKFCKAHISLPGASKLHNLREHIIENAASPMEIRCALLLGEPTRFGGGGLGRPQMNYEICANATARRLTGKKLFRCDLFWPEYNLCVEYQSREFHTDETARQNDSKRLNAMSALGIKMRYVTSSQIRSLTQAAALIEILRRDANKRQRTKIKDLPTRRLKLMRELGLIR